MTTAPHEHEWRDLPTLDTNPPSEARECATCGALQMRLGVGYTADGQRIEPTAWRTERAA